MSTLHVIRDVNLPTLLWMYVITDAQWSLFSLKSRTFELEPTNWADKFWGIWGIFDQTISIHFVHVFHVVIFNHYFYKKLSLYIHTPNKFGIGIGIWIFNFSILKQNWRYFHLLPWLHKQPKTALWKFSLSYISLCNLG